MWIRANSRSVAGQRKAASVAAPCAVPICCPDSGTGLPKVNVFSLDPSEKGAHHQGIWGQCDGREEHCVLIRSTRVH